MNSDDYGRRYITIRGNVKVNKQVNICSLDRVVSATVDGPVSSLTKCNNAGLERLSRAANVRHSRHAR